MSNKFWTVVWSGASFFLGACQGESGKSETEATMIQNNGKAVVYQVFTRLFGNANTTNKPWGTKSENGVGKFADFTPKALS